MILTVIFADSVLMMKVSARNCTINVCWYKPFPLCMRAESCTSQSCDLPKFDCIWRDRGYKSFSSPTTMTTSQVIYPTTTVTLASDSKMSPPVDNAKNHGLIVALGTIIGLLGLLVLLLITGWMWMYSIMKKRTTKSSTMNRFV